MQPELNQEAFRFIAVAIIDVEEEPMRSFSVTLTELDPVSNSHLSQLTQATSEWRESNHNLGKLVLESLQEASSLALLAIRSG